MSYFKIFVLFFAVSFSVFANKQPQEPGEHINIECMDGKQSFSLYLPESYETKVQKYFPVLYISSPKGFPSFLKLQQWAEEKEFILICINDSRNSDLAVVTAAQDEVLKSTGYLRKHHCLQFATGQSVGAWASVKFAQRYPKTIAGVLYHSHSGNKDYCVKGQSVAFLYGAKDTKHSPASVQRSINYYQSKKYHLNFKKLNAGSVWGGLEDTKGMLNFMYDYQRLNNKYLSRQELTATIGEIEAEFVEFIKSSDAVQKEKKLLNLISMPLLLKSKTGKKILFEWSRVLVKTLKDLTETPKEAYALLIDERRAPRLNLVSGPSKSEFNKLKNDILRNKQVRLEIKAFDDYKLLFKREARLKGDQRKIDALIKRYNKLIETHVDTLAADMALERIKELKGK